MCILLGLLFLLMHIYFTLHEPRRWLLLTRIQKAVRCEKSDLDDNMQLISEDNHTQYLLESNQCQVRWYNPNDPSIKKYIKNNYIPCSPTRTVLAYQDGNMLRLYHNLTRKLYPTFNGCHYIPIVRKRNSDTGFKLLFSKKVEFSNDTSVKYEFIKLECFAENNLVYEDYFAFILPKLYSEKRIVDNTRNNINVLMIGYESISRNLFIRSCPKLRKRLTELGAIELKVYTKVGENTFPNMLALFSGKTLQDLKDLGWNATQHLDQFKFLWDEFHENGYRTAWAEDAAIGGLFNLYKGFEKEQTDYYYRPFAIAYAANKRVWTKSHCIGNRHEVSMTLQYLSDFIQLYQNDPFFAMGFNVRNTHGDSVYVNMIEEPNIIFLNRIQSMISKNTALFFFSDHGQRLSKIRGTEIGRWEGNLPIMYVILPLFIRENYPELVTNLENNAAKLTTTWDVHKTVLHLLNLTGSYNSEYVSEKRGISLLGQMPTDRSCGDAGINKRFCPCLSMREINQSQICIKNAANFAVDYLNMEMKNVNNLCEELRLVDIDRAYEVIPRSKTEIMFFVVFKTNPGDALFEAYIQHNDTHGFSINENPIRVNQYGNQSYCVHDTYIQTICYCSGHLQKTCLDSHSKP